MAVPAGIPQFTIPEDYDSISNWFWGDIAPIVSRWQDDAAGGTLFPTYQSSMHIGGSQPSGIFSGSGADGTGGGNYKIGHYSGPARSYAALSQLDQNIAEWGGWINTDPRSSFQQALQAANANPAFDTQGVYGDQTMVPGALSSLISQEAIRQKLKGLGVADAGIQQVIEGLYDPWTAPQGATGNFANNPNLYIPDSTLDGPWAGVGQLFTNAGLQFDAPMGQAVTNYAGANVNAISDANLLAALANAGVTPAPLPSPNTPTPATSGINAPAPATPTYASGSSNVADQTSNPAILSPFGTFMQMMAGFAPVSFDSNGRPTYGTTQDIFKEYFNTDGSYSEAGQKLWEQRHPGSLFGPKQLNELRQQMTALPMNAQQQGARALLDPAVLNEQFNKTLGAMDTQVLPAMKNLMDTGYRSPSRDLYTDEQYGIVQDQARTGWLGDLQKAGNTYYQNDILPQLREQAAGQMGSFSTDFLGASAREGQNLNAKLLEQATANRNAGIGNWNTMTQGQGLFESSLDEAAAARRANAIQPYAELLGLRNNMPTAYATDLNTIGENFAAQDEARRPGANNMSYLMALLNGTAPSNVGYVTQGKTPSAQTSLFSGFAPQAQNFGAAGGNWLGTALNFANQSGLTSLIGGGLTKAASGIADWVGGLFDNWGSDGFSWTGDSNYDRSRRTA